jgi:hypothetical protein
MGWHGKCDSMVEIGVGRWVGAEKIGKKTTRKNKRESVSLNRKLQV